MDKDSIYAIREIGTILNIPICVFNNKAQTVETYNNVSNNMVMCLEDRNFAEKLAGLCKECDIPVIYVEDEKYYYCLIYLDKSDYMFAGPVSMNSVTHTDIREYCLNHGIKYGEEESLCSMDMVRFISFSSLVYYLACGKKYSNEEILKLNNIQNTVVDIEKERTLLNIENEDAFTIYHHSYRDELLWLAAIRHGNVEEAEERIDVLIGHAGNLSSHILRHYINIGVVAVSLAARAAMEGGVAPSDAYKISDIFLNRFDKCTDVIHIYNLIKESSTEYASRVRKAKSEEISADYVEYCKKYIDEHYSEKLTLKNIADAIGVNKNYLTHMFSKKENMNMREYINRVRIKHAANMLRYSQLSVSEISERLCFSSQSHFGELFKRYAGMSPKQYRKTKQIVDITEQKIT